MRDTVVIFLIAAATAVGILLISMVLAVSAPAQEWAGNTPRWTNAPKARPKFRRRHRHREHRETRRVIVIRERRTDPHEHRACMPHLSVVGDQAQSKPGAQAQAWKAFQQQARALYGEIFADPDHAGDATYRCWHSSIKNLANRLTEKIGVDSQFERCLVRARPCRAPAEERVGQR